MDGQEPQLPHESVEPLLDAGHKVGQICVKVVVDVQPAGVGGAEED